MDVTSFLQRLTANQAYAGQITHQRTVPAHAPVWAPFPEALQSPARAFLLARGIHQLYQHQVTAIQAALAGEDMVVTTGPASGKSVCYQVPMLQALTEDPQATALLLFPTKALARDQAIAWNEGIESALGAQEAESLRAMPLDGDVDTGGRRQARDRGRVVLTNPEMLHVSMLPHHARWTRFFSGLRFVVLDEAHVYTGFFGSNMANVIRRLERVCQVHGARVQYLCTSATLGNPADLTRRLIGRPARLIEADTGAAGERTFVVWNPPRIQKRSWRGRRSANVEAHELMVQLLEEGAPTICFSKARNTAEMLYRYVRDALSATNPALAQRVIPYRGGYSSEERLEFEAGLREGHTLGVCSTRALELGIDIGTLEACIIIGYPGTLNAFFQQAGRVGRAGRDSLVILVTIDTPINQYIVQHPEFLFQRPIEQAVVDADNPFVVLGHLACSAAELPLAPGEEALFGYAGGLAVDVLTEHGDLTRVGSELYHGAATPPAPGLRLRGYGDESTVVVDVDGERIIDRLDKFRALRLFYPGAIYFRGGDTYAMVDHDTDRNIVHVQRVEVSYYTDPVTGTGVDHVDVQLTSRPLGAATACLGEVYALASTPMYERVQFYTLERISQHPIDLPPFAYEAMSFWLRLPEDLVHAVAAAGLNPELGMKGVLFCVSRIVPLFLASDANDFDWSVGCRNTPWHTMFWYEFYLRGIGNAEQCYQRLEAILAVALEHLLTCDCVDGCPNCTTRLITPYHVRNIELGEGNVGSRQAAVVLLHAVLHGTGVEAGLAALQQERPRGQALLPTVDVTRWQREPHELPLSDHTRQLLRRKLERASAPRPELGHPIDADPPVGIPAPGADGAAPGPPGGSDGLQDRAVAATDLATAADPADSDPAPGAPATAPPPAESSTADGGNVMRRSGDRLHQRLRQYLRQRGQRDQ
jgi:DEAD/DEAH box helicase domain-containing protein